MRCTSDIALLFFARSPYSDKKRKAFPSEKLHMEVVSHLHFKTRQRLEDTGLPVIVSNERTQKHRSLPRNLSHAISMVFEAGYRKVIVVGNDCPELDDRTLQRAIDALRNGKNVLGPDMQGGNYLIGIDKSDFCLKSFENALRVKAKVHKNLSTLLQKNNTPIVLLDSKHDINNSLALCQYVQWSEKSNGTYSFLRSVYFAFIDLTEVWTDYLLIHYAPAFSSGHSRRGPPVHTL